ncbi:PASTA domain-containing protein [Nocardioides anomalus]|uniref:PASTA domain-containing protein n=1 Tax=Nocardioides anomalus TaxID=2712223 RepID=A0A6G6WJH0_9ACTN|nr:PASTA domain-containing protein [Nocardioides anomalus]QIG45362.1 PASTA domain-containing protein [Nocardioides anomalus]
MPIPRLVRACLVLSVAAAGLAVTAPAAQAQATRTWVSGVGDDVNPCSRTAPCKTFAGAISKTASGGVINVIDDGGYGAVTITKPITIDGTGHLASILVVGTPGVTINAPTDAQVVLRDIDIKSTNTGEGTCGATTGVNIIGAASVRLDDVRIAGFTTAVGGSFANSPVDAFLDLSVNDARINDNCTAGIGLAPAAGHAVRLALDSSTITGSNTALSVGAGAEAWVSNTRMYLNNTGLDRPGGTIHSACGNQVAGNATDGTFTDDLCGKVTTPTTTPTTPPTTTTPAPAPTYCTVPSLKKKSAARAGAALTAAGCTLGKVTRKHAGTKLRGKVITQAVEAGIEVKPGTAVGVVIGK